MSPKFFRPVVVAAAALTARVAATQDLVGATVVRGDPDPEARRVESSSAFATSVELRTRARLAESLGELLLEAPGVQLRRMGDGFAPQRLSLRGAPAAHIAVAIDGVVLNPAGGEAVDLSLIPPALVERADIYRGAIPLRFGSGGLAGAVELTTRAIPRRATSWVGLGFGSFLSRRAGLFVAARAGAIQGLLALSYRGTEGNFSYYDTRGTDEPRDDGEATRTNNATDVFDALARFCIGRRRSADSPCIQLLASARRRGIAGVAGYPWDGPFSERRSLAVRVGAPIRGRAGTLDLYAAASAREERLDNRGPRPITTLDEGLDRATGLHAELGARGRGRWRMLRFEGVVRGRAERVDADSGGAPDGSRLGLWAGAEALASVGPVELLGGAGLELLSDHSGGTQRDRLVASPRLGAQWRVVRGLSLRANAAWLQRAPTLTELYGDRGVLVGNPSLRNERAVNGDLGAVLDLAGRRWGLRLEVAGFARALEDVVVLRQTDRALYRPINRDAAAVLGVEAQARFTLAGALRVTLAYAFIDARITAGQSGTQGNRLPGVSPHDLFARVEAIGSWLRASVELSAQDETPLDDTNATVVPARALLGATVALRLPFARALSLSAQVTNLLDARVADRPLANPLGTLARAPSPLQDWLGFPIPGRAVFAMVSFEDPTSERW